MLNLDPHGVFVEHVASKQGGVGGAGGGVLVAVEHLVDVVEVGAGLGLSAASLVVPVFGQAFLARGQAQA